jgi:phospholipid/cholesterol/gamma-HCH transport system substrate-binding protein
MGRRIELGVGLFMVAGIAALAYLSVNLGRVDILGQRGYVVYADFPSVGGLKSGASVEIAGVSVGRVQSIGLNDYQARVALQIDTNVKLQTDAIVSIKTKGLIGEKFVLISPGGSDKVVAPGGRLTEVEAPVDIEELISKYVFGKV